MNKFFKKSAALVLVSVLLTTGCSGKKEAAVSDSSETSEDIGFNSENLSNSSNSVSSVSDSDLNSESSSDSSDASSNIESSETASSENSASSSDGEIVSTDNDEGDTNNDDTNNGGTPDNGDMNNGGNPDNDDTSNGGNPDNNNTNNGGTTDNNDTNNGGQPDNNDTNNGGTPDNNDTNNDGSDSGFSCSWKAENTWEESGKQCGTVELTIKNDTGRSVSSWTAEFAVPSGFEITTGWSGTYSVNGTTAKVSNVEYNGEIPTGGSVSVGFNYSSPTVFTPPSSVNINGTAGSSSGGNGQNGGNDGNNGGNGGNNGGNGGTDKNQDDPAPSEDMLKLLERSDKAVQGDDWLHTDGNRILDKNGKQVWLTGVNWFGYNTGTNTFDGLWNSQMRGTVKAIADHGFNLIRVPISAELLNQWSNGEYPKANFNSASNPEMNDMNSLQIFDYFLKLAEENGMKVMPDIHSAETNAMGHNVNLWFTDRISLDDYYSALEWLANRYKDNDTIIAIDLKNEPHGKPYEGSGAAIWNDSTDKNNWKYTAEQAASKILAKNSNVLIMIEGTEIYSKNNGSYSSTNDADYYFNWWGGNLRGVKDYPVDLGEYQNKVVYSPHDYGPTVYEQPWFAGGFDYNSLIDDCWQDNWLYIHKDNIAPLLIGEWGGFMKEPNLKWMTCMRTLIGEYHLNHTFWCYNANSGDTGGLVLDDFTTWDTEKYNFVKEVLWQENGKFVGLDHAIPLGENGISVSNANGL